VSFNQTINTTAGNATTVNASSVNVTLEITTNASVTDANITVSSYTSNPTNTSFSVPSLGKYIEITASATLSGSLNYTLLRVQYTDAEVAAAGLNESELALWWHNTTTNTWQILNSSTMSWVHATGVDTTANFVWANVTHFSVYTVAESSQISQTPLTSGWNLISVPLTNQ
jgi:hypothetical protein